MPEPEQPEKAASLWAIVKNAIGRDLRNLPLPVELHEPITDLQKMAENTEYTELLDQVCMQRMWQIKFMNVFIAMCIAIESGTYSDSMLT